MSGAGVRKYTFDTVFEPGGKIVQLDPLAKTRFTRDEVEAACAAARTEGENGAVAAAEARAAAALERLAGAAEAALSRLDAESAALKTDAAGLSLMAARAIAGAALEAYPDAALDGLVADVADELRVAPRVRVTLPEALLDRLGPRVEAALAAVGFAGRADVVPAPDAAAGDVALDWGRGSVSERRDDASASVEAAIRNWLIQETGEAAQLDLFTAPEDPA